MRTHTHHARQLGRETGKNAASWVFDGNTSRETYTRFLQGIEDGDPEVLDSVREPNLSGEFADDPTPQTLAEELGVDPDDYRLDGYSDEWLSASSTAFWYEIERQCRYQLEDEEKS